MENFPKKPVEDLTRDSEGNLRELVTLLDGTIASLSKKEAAEANSAIRESLGN